VVATSILVLSLVVEGLRPVQVLVSEQDIDYLLAKDYELTRTDDRSIGSAVSAFLSDSVLEAGYP
jgi:hypothetical protein